MELRYPIILIIGIIMIVLFLFFSSKKKKSYTNGTKIANTKYLKNNKLFQKKLKKYQTVLITLKSLCIFSILISLILLARPSKVDSKRSNEYNRDIVLCMDISASVYELDADLVKNLKNTVNSLKGERFSISIFNTTSVTLTPLTDDYEFIISTLKDVEKGIDISLNGNEKLDSGQIDYQEYFYYKSFIRDGTLEGNTERGSSIIGDGLASCIYNFSNLEEERTRIIIFSTDNDDASEPGKKIITLEEAAALANKKGIKVFGIGTKGIYDNKEKEFKEAIENNGGKYYSESKESVENIVNDIEKTSKSLLPGHIETKKMDIPEIPFILLLISTTSFILLNKKVKS